MENDIVHFLPKINVSRFRITRLLCHSALGLPSLFGTWACTGGQAPSHHQLRAFNLPISLPPTRTGWLCFTSCRVWENKAGADQRAVNRCCMRTTFFTSLTVQFLLLRRLLPGHFFFLLAFSALVHTQTRSRLHGSEGACAYLRHKWHYCFDSMTSRSCVRIRYYSKVACMWMIFLQRSCWIYVHTQPMFWRQYLKNSKSYAKIVYNTSYRA